MLTKSTFDYFANLKARKAHFKMDLILHNFYLSFHGGPHGMRGPGELSPAPPSQWACPWGIEQQSRRVLRRHKYKVCGPNNLWHIDGLHKLIGTLLFMVARST